MVLLTKYSAACNFQTVGNRWGSRVHTDREVGGNCGRGKQKVNAADRLRLRAQTQKPMPQP